MSWWRSRGTRNTICNPKIWYAKGQLPTLCAMSNPGKYPDEMISVIIICTRSCCTTVVMKEDARWRAELKLNLLYTSIRMAPMLLCDVTMWKGHVATDFRWAKLRSWYRKIGAESRCCSFQQSWTETKITNWILTPRMWHLGTLTRPK
jgi:hypothetical protein